MCAMCVSTLGRPHCCRCRCPWLAGAGALEDLGASWSSPLSLRPFCSAGSSSAACVVPSVRFDPGKAAIACSALHLDVLCYVPKSMSATDAIDKVGCS
jgi:hypothetical protein